LAEHDYSGTPLTTKPGAKPGAHVVVYFTTSLSDLERPFAKLKRTLAPAATERRIGPDVARAQ
jgi:hypothetical protein